MFGNGEVENGKFIHQEFTSEKSRKVEIRSGIEKVDSVVYNRKGMLSFCVGGGRRGKWING